jgi:hypothetical protein
MHRRLHLPALLILAAVGTGCDAPPDDSHVQETRQRLTGTWLREYQEGNVRVRRVLVLAPGGLFTERVVAAAPEGTRLLNSHSGEWHYDGMNLKRRYTLIDGRKPSAPTFPYAAFQVAFESRHVFVGTDNIRRRKVRYERVNEGTEP